MLASFFIVCIILRIQTKKAFEMAILIPKSAFNSAKLVEIHDLTVHHHVIVDLMESSVDAASLYNCVYPLQIVVNNTDYALQLDLSMANNTRFWLIKGTNPLMQGFVNHPSLRLARNQGEEALKGVYDIIIEDLGKKIESGVKEIITIFKESRSLFNNGLGV